MSEDTSAQQSLRSLSAEDLELFCRFLLDLADDRRNFLIGFLSREAPQFIRRFEESLPSLQKMIDLPPRFAQKLLQETSFDTLGWVLYGADRDVVQFCGENLSKRGRQILYEEVEKVRALRRRWRENERGEEKFRAKKKDKTLDFKLQLQVSLANTGAKKDETPGSQAASGDRNT